MEFADYIRSPKCDRVVLHQPLCAPLDGTLCITCHHFIFSSRQTEAEEVWVLHRMIDGVERRPNGMMGGSLSVKCKDLRILVLDIHGVEEFNNIAYSLEMLSNVDDVRLAYPFFFRSSPNVEDGSWSEFSTEHEFSKLIMRSDDWRISNVNSDFKVCDSYPRSVVVPSTITDEELVQVAQFRHGGRFPVLSYRHDKGSILLRSSQPMTGNQRRCREDEKLINAALSGGGQKGYIIDTRTANLAMSAKNRGGGFEPEVHYPQWRRVHKPIDRHAAQLDSLQRLVDGLNDPAQTQDKWLTRLVSSNWMSHVKDTLNCACLVAQCLDQEGASVLVHGSDGMASTLQVSALAQLILNPDCRTIRGFEALVEREWLQAGHPFSTRHRHSIYAPALTRDRGHGMAPSFLLFLDCVWQVTNQFVTSFQFNDQFLLDLFQHSYASQYGTFLGDNPCERERIRLRERTCSLWSYMNRHDVLAGYLNPLYEPNKRVIWPTVAPMSLTLWPGMFLRWTVDLSSQKAARARAHEIHKEHAELKTKAVKLRRRLLELQREAVRRGLLQPPATPDQVTESEVFTPDSSGAV